ncbi:MAG TPA: heme exporter protein CcmD [Burkholderiales bacterium]|jgi:heme exporter protein D|nr:heme exporter protein CcmD [Burkholderiales bacterium]
MQWDSVSEFFAMGGYALYVWGSYLVTAVVLGVEVWQLRRRSRTLRALTGRKVESEGSEA